jgi:hypothetical protein
VGCVRESSFRLTSFLFRLVFSGFWVLVRLRSHLSSAVYVPRCPPLMHFFLWWERVRVIRTQGLVTPSPTARYRQTRQPEPGLHQTYGPPRLGVFGYRNISELSRSCGDLNGHSVIFLGCDKLWAGEVLQATMRCQRISVDRREVKKKPMDGSGRA